MKLHQTEDGATAPLSAASQRRFDLEDYLAALYDDTGQLVGPGQCSMVLRRAKEDPDISLGDFKKLCAVASGRMDKKKTHS